MEGSLCQEVGLCVHGSGVLALNYRDFGTCDYDKDCPRYYPLSTSQHELNRNVATFDGKSVSRHPSFYRGDYQRPAL
ncbi:MAG: hypothetical protein HFG16_02930 [Erysipelotrichaceae bacterium]|nr:hypothetical protein [Erysipelotrichaceae bacterium]